MILFVSGTIVAAAGTIRSAIPSRVRRIATRSIDRDALRP